MLDVFVPFFPLFIRIHHFTVPCSWHICVSCYSCWWVIACHFPSDVPFPFLQPHCQCVIHVLFLLYTIIMLVQCTSIVIIILHLNLSSSSSFNLCLSFVSWWSFCCFSFYFVLFFSVVIFMLLYTQFFSTVHQNFTAVYLYDIVGQIIHTWPPHQFPNAFCSFSL